MKYCKFNSKLLLIKDSLESCFRHDSLNRPFSLTLKENFIFFSHRTSNTTVSHSLFCNKFLLKSSTSFPASQSSCRDRLARLVAREKMYSLQIYIKMNFKAIQTVGFWQDFTYYEEEKNRICLSKWWNWTHICQVHSICCWNVLLTLNTICFVK